MDILTELRETQKWATNWHDKMKRAADEIERLRKVECFLQEELYDLKRRTTQPLAALATPSEESK